MATIVNETGSRVYRDRHIDVTLNAEDYGISEVELNSTLSSDSGGMRNEAAKDFDVASAVARTIPKKKLNRTYQWNTKNKSFIKLHQDLEQLGIKRNKFFLVLCDPVLMDVDPYATVVPLEIQARIFKECMINPWYFLREICRIPEDGSPIKPGGGTMFKIDRNSAATWYLFINGIDHYSSKPRQQGKTQDALAKINYVYHFGAVSTQITFSNKDLTLNKLNLSRLKTQRDLLPLWMQMKTVVNVETLKIDKEQSNVTSMKNPITKNSILLLPSASTISKAEGIGRGYTSALQFWDEFDWTANNTIMINAAVFAYKSAVKNAQKNHSMYGRLFTSTPGNMDTKEGREAEVFINGKSDENGRVPGMLKWRDEMFDSPISEIKKVLSSTSYNGIVFVEHSWQQLKCSMEWYERACQDVRYDPEQIAREICLKRLRGSSKSPFTRAQIMYLCNNVQQPESSIDLSDNYAPIFFYEKLNRRTPYIMGVDTAEGLGSDNMAMVLINPYTEKVAAEFASPNIDQRKMGKMVINFMMKYCPKSMIVPENNRGREFIHIIQESMFADRLWIDVDKFGDKEKINTADETLRNKAIGFNTSTKTRPMVLGMIGHLVKEEPEKVNSKFVVDDVCSLERDPKHDNKIAAAPGKHDDVIMAFGIAHTVLHYATNLSDYGITPGMIPPEQVDTKDPKYIIAKMKELAASLPIEMRDMFRVDRTEVDDAFEYGNQVAKARTRSQITEMSSHNQDIEEMDPNLLNTYNSPDMYNDFVDEVTSMNRFMQKDDNFIDFSEYL